MMKILIMTMLFAQMISTGNHRKIFPSSGCGSLPVTDNFSGSGALSTCWTQSSDTVDFVPLVRSSGVVVPNTTGAQGQATFTGVVFGATQYAQAVIVWVDKSGICVSMSVAGTGACYIPHDNVVASFTNGSYVGNMLSGCSSLTSGHTAKLAIASGIYTVTDVTTSAVLCSGTGSVFTGTPGIVVDHRVNSTDSITNFEAD
jgi:hypothetical protein